MKLSIPASDPVNKLRRPTVNLIYEEKKKNKRREKKNIIQKSPQLLRYSGSSDVD